MRSRGEARSAGSLGTAGSGGGPRRRDPRPVLPHGPRVCPGPTGQVAVGATVRSRPRPWGGESRDTPPGTSVAAGGRGRRGHGVRDPRAGSFASPWAAHDALEDGQRAPPRDSSRGVVAIQAVRSWSRCGTVGSRRRWRWDERPPAGGKQHLDHRRHSDCRSTSMTNAASLPARTSTSSTGSSPDSPDARRRRAPATARSTGRRSPQPDPEIPPGVRVVAA